MKKDQIKTLGDLFLYISENGPQPLFSYFNNNESVEITPTQFKDDVLRMAGTVNELSSTKRIALLGENCYTYLIAFFAIAVSGKVPVMLDKGLDRDTLAQVMQIAEVTCILHSDDYKNLGASFDLDHYSVNDLFLKCTDRLKTPVKTELDDVAIIFHTSSSTGFPKVVPLSNKNIVTELQSLSECVCFDGTALLCLPAYHVYGMIANILFLLYSGVRLHINLSLRHLLDDFKRVRPTLLSVVPVMVNLLFRAMKGDGSVEALRNVTGGNLKYICFGGAPFTIDPTLLLSAGIQVYIGYGLTETASSITIRLIDEPTSDIDNVGKQIPGAVFRIGEHNELLIKSDTICRSYLNSDSLVQSAFEQGWFKTGDTGYLDDNGDVHITGRIKNLIILPNGENVPAEKLEALLYQLPYINECIVKEQNGKITAFIYCQQADYAKQHVKDDLSKINASLPLSHNITAIEFRDVPFEKTSVQKIKRI